MFNSKWGQDCFMLEIATHSMCLIWSHVLKTVKGDNAKQHCRRHMSHDYVKLKGESRKKVQKNRRDSKHLASLLLLNLIIIPVRLPTEWPIIVMSRESLISMGN